MWLTFGRFIIRNRFWLLVAIGVLTIISAYETTKVQLTYDFAKVVPNDDPDFIEYTNFKQMFGEDGNVLVVGVQNKKLFEKDFFNDWYKLSCDVEKIEGVEKVISLGNIYSLSKNEDKCCAL